MSNVETPAITCPKCHGAMRQYERSGVIVDQCEECRGIFLDRGELERLVAAEDVHTAAAPPAAAPPTAPPGYPPQQQPGGGGFFSTLFGEGHHGGHHGRRYGHH